MSAVFASSCVEEGVVDGVLHEDALDRAADLPGAVRQAALHHGLRRRAQIGVLEHDHRVGAAELERDALQGLRGRARDGLRRADAAGEADQPDVGIGDQRIAQVLGEPGQHLHAVGREAGLEHQLADAKHGQRALLRQLDDHRGPGGERAGHLVGEELGGVVERDDADDDADGLADGVGDHVLEPGDAVHRQVVAANTLGFLGEVDEQPLGRHHFRAALADGLAVLAREPLAEVLELRPDQVGGPPQEIAAAMGRDRGHDVSALARTVERSLHILDAGPGHRVDQLARCRITDLVGGT